MAYYLSLENSAYVTMPVPVYTRWGDLHEFTFEIYISSAEGNQQFPVMNNATTGFTGIVVRHPQNDVIVAGRYISANNLIALDQWQQYRIVSNGLSDGYDLYIDGAYVNGVSNSNQHQYNFLFINGDNKQAGCRVKNIGYKKNGVDIFNYQKQTLNGPNDTAFTDTVGGNDGTLINFPTDDSQWVFYSDATGVTADVAYIVGAPTFSSTASVTLPAPVSDVAFTVNAPIFAASADATLPQPLADAAFTINAPTFSASASATIPGFNASVDFAIPSPTFTASAYVTLPNPTADVNYTVSAPTFNVSANASLPQPSSDVSFTVSTPLFAATATATEPNFNASVNFTVGAPVFSGSASATLPQPVADTNFTVSAPTFSVVAIVGGIAIIVDEETNINQRVLSNNINAQILSNNING